MILSGESVVNYEGLFHFIKLLSKHLGELEYYRYYEDEDGFKFFEEYPHLDEFSEALGRAVYSYDYGDVDNFYFEMGLPKSKEYARWYRDFSDYMWDIGLGVSEGYFDNEGSHKVYHAGLPCEDIYLEKLEETGDYWWFLVSVIQKYSSPCDSDFVLNPEEISEIIEETYENYKNKFSFEWFTPFKVYLTSQKLMQDYKNRSLKSITEDFSSVDFSSLPEFDLSNVPEFEIEHSFVEKNGKYYAVTDVLLAITAAGGMAQALERQDLESKVTSVNTVLKKNKKKPGVKNEPRET